MWAKQYVVYKIGGSILRNYRDITHTLEFLLSRELEGSVVVVSAVKGVTDLIIDLCRGRYPRDDALEAIYAVYSDIIDGFGLEGFSSLLDSSIRELERLSRLCGTSKAALDEALSFGELFTSRLIYSLLESRLGRAVYIDHRMMGLTTDSNFGDARPILSVSRRNIARRLGPLLNRGYTVVVPGFIGVDRRGRTTTMGRGASDLTASVIAFSLDAAGLYFVTDTSGILSSDPRYVRDPKPVKCLDLEEAEYASRYRVKGIHPLAFKILKRFRGGIMVMDRFGDGTAICGDCRDYGPKILVGVGGKYVVIGRYSKHVLSAFSSGLEDLGLKVSSISDLYIELESPREGLDMDQVYRLIFSGRRVVHDG